MTSDAEPVLLVDVSDGVAVATLNRPARRYAGDPALVLALDDAVRRLDADPSVGAIVLTGTDPAFCAGLDLVELRARGGAMGTRPVVYERGLLPPTSTPIVGAVNGPAVTGGLELALSCDLLVASDRARFADTHARVGVMPGAGMTVRLPRRVGVARAKEMTLTGNFVLPETALAWGLVNHVVPHDELLPFCRRLAADIADNDREAVRALLDTYDRGTAVTEEAAWSIEATARRAWIDGHQGQEEEEDEPERRARVIARGRRQLGP